MRWRNSFPAALLIAASAIALWPAIAQRSPESILPPGFGEPEPANATRPTTERPPRPTDEVVPDVRLTPPDAATSNGAQADVIGDLIEDTSNNSMAVLTAPLDLPPQARRSLERVGVASADETGFAPNAYGTTDGRFLGTLMQRMDAPIASRWLSIVLRRSLLAQSDIPPGIAGADWVAQRAWLLVRMGEADMARALIARVDAENFTPKLFEASMQAALATGDPASVCAVANAAATVSDEASWPLAQAMCAGLSGESGTASALVDRVRDNGSARGIDVLLAEKVVGAATNTRRSVSIQWDGVDTLTAWRFGLAAATGVAVPPNLFATAGPQVQAWQARAPLIAPAARAPFAERAAAMGVFSSEALVDFFGSVWDTTDPAERSGSVGEMLRTAYSGDESARLGRAHPGGGGGLRPGVLGLRVPPHPARGAWAVAGRAAAGGAAGRGAFDLRAQPAEPADCAGGEHVPVRRECTADPGRGIRAGVRAGGVGGAARALPPVLPAGAGGVAGARGVARARAVGGAVFGHGGAPEMSGPVLTVVVPCFNEEAVLPETSRRLGDILARFEAEGRVAAGSHVCFVDDGSNDGTWRLIEGLAAAGPERFGGYGCRATGGTRMRCWPGCCRPGGMW